MIFKDGVGRKFLTCFLLLWAHYAALCTKVITPEVYMSLLWVVLGALIGGNMGERIIEKRAAKEDK